MRIRVLGGVEVDHDPVPARLTPQSRRLLAVLVAQGGDEVSVHRLVDDLGVDDVVSVRMAVSRLRKVLGERIVTTSRLPVVRRH